MRFVDELNNNNNNDSGAESVYSSDLKGIHSAIRNACKDNREKKQTSGFVVRNYDNEYGVHGFSYVESLNKDNTRNLSLSSKYVKSGTRYSASVVSDEFYQHRQGLKPISTNDDCKCFITDLHSLLSDDGFTDIALDVISCYDEYDEVKIQSGLFNSKSTLERKSTNKLLGYVIRFSLHW